MDVVLTVRFDFKHLKNCKKIAKQIADAVVEFAAESDETSYHGGPIWSTSVNAAKESKEKSIPIGTYSIVCKSSRSKK